LEDDDEIELKIEQDGIKSLIFSNYRDNKLLHYKMEKEIRDGEKREVVYNYDKISQCNYIYVVGNFSTTTKSSIKKIVNCSGLLNKCRKFFSSTCNHSVYIGDEKLEDYDVFDYQTDETDGYDPY